MELQDALDAPYYAKCTFPKTEKVYQSVSYDKKRLQTVVKILSSEICRLNNQSCRSTSLRGSAAHLKLVWHKVNVVMMAEVCWRLCSRQCFLWPGLVISSSASECEVWVFGFQGYSLLNFWLTKKIRYTDATHVDSLAFEENDLLKSLSCQLYFKPGGWSTAMKFKLNIWNIRLFSYYFFISLKYVATFELICGNKIIITIYPKNFN